MTGIPSTAETAPLPEPVTSVESAPEPTPPATLPSVVEPTVEEPQNALTKKFTDKEWNSLKAFRETLPEAFAEAYPDIDNATAKTTPITIWKITIDPSNPAKDPRVSVVLMKFLRARNLNVQEAKSMFVSTLRWRSIFDVDAALKEEFPEDIFGKLGYIYGHDKELRPVVYNVYGGNTDTKAVFGDVQRFLRWRVALMEKTIAELDFETVDQTVQIHDYAGVSMFSRDASSKQAASEATAIFQNYYPELLHVKFFVNVPALMSWLFWFFKPLVSSKTFSKLNMVGTGKGVVFQALSPVIDAKELPKRYGGDAEGF